MTILRGGARRGAALTAMLVLLAGCSHQASLRTAEDDNFLVVSAISDPGYRGGPVDNCVATIDKASGATINNTCAAGEGMGQSVAKAFVGGVLPATAMMAGHIVAAEVAGGKRGGGGGDGAAVAIAGAAAVTSVGVSGMRYHYEE